MAFDYRIPLFSTLAGGGVIYMIFLMPPLTSGGAQSSEGISAEEYEAIVEGERAYCQTQPQAVNCQCFAERSGAILTHDAPQVPGAFYADKQQLARGQALRGC